jgi:hypothetical protein
MSKDQTKDQTKAEIKAKFGKELSQKDNGNNHTVVWLDGQAPTQHNPEALSIVGTITAPSIFVKYRSSIIDTLKSHALVSVFDGTIKLVVNEKDTTAKYTIEGKIKESKRFKQLGINDPSVSYEPQKLSKKLRLLRTLFRSPSDHSKLVSALRNFKATIDAKINENDDLRGNLSQAMDMVVETSIPETFTLVIPLFEGEKPQEIEVSIFFDITGGNGIMCYLESVDAADSMEEQRETLIAEEVLLIERFVTVMFH